jgi:PHP family Zn ribbon phosphoesterase
MGREANIFDSDVSYGAITGAIRTGKGFMGTIEFFPEEGKYHFDGHRACKMACSPEETIQHNYLCPRCGKRMTIGVMHRVQVLADRKKPLTPQGAPGYHSLIPLPEIIAEARGVGANSKAVADEYMKMLVRLGNEFKIVMDMPLEEIEQAAPPLVAEGIGRMRARKVHIEPGYDGEYGKVKIFDDGERGVAKGQGALL